MGSAIEDGDADPQACQTLLPGTQVSRFTALNAKLIVHHVWMWGLKPASIGLLAVLAASPLLIVSPLVADALNVDISKTGVIVMACLVWTSATSAYLFARRSGVLDERDRLPRRKVRPERRASIVNHLLGVEDDAQVRKKADEVVRDLLRQAENLIDEERYDEALRLHRDAMRKAMRAFQRTDDYWLLYLALYAYYGTFLCAMLTGRTEEAAMAVETGIVRAGIGIERWPGVPEFVERQALFASMKWKTGLEGVAYLPDDYSHWPFDDQKSQADASAEVVGSSSSEAAAFSHQALHRQTFLAPILLAQGIDAMNNHGASKEIADGLPPPPIPKELFESLIPYGSDYIESIRQALSVYVDGLRGTLVDFDQEYFEIQSVIYDQVIQFLKSAEIEYRSARNSGHEENAKHLWKKCELMRLWAHYHEIGSVTEVIDYIETHKEELQLTTLNYESPVGIGLKNE